MKKKKYNNYICLVDYYRPYYLQRRTRGRYRVGAKNEKEAKQLVQKAIGFGSVVVYYKDDKLLAKYKEVWKEEPRKNVPDKNRTKENNFGFELVPVRHATAPIKREAEL